MFKHCFVNGQLYYETALDNYRVHLFDKGLCAALDKEIVTRKSTARISSFFFCHNDMVKEYRKWMKEDETNNSLKLIFHFCSSQGGETGWLKEQLATGIVKKNVKT